MASNFFFGSAGTYTVEDDGIRGNGVSVVRDSGGNIVYTVVHPGDDVNFIATVPGVTLVFNTADSFGTANVNVGSLTDPTQCPDFIVVKNLQTDAFITLVAEASITEGGSDAAADIRAAGVLLSAGTGVGTAANAIDTQIVFIEAETQTGGINLANFGSVQIGGLSSEIRGMDVVDSGDINFSTTGFILVADTTGPQSIHGGDSSGNVTLTAIGADSDIITNIDRPAISAAGGGINLNAGRDVSLGTAGANFNNDLLATGSIAIHAGRDFVLDGNSDLKTSAFGGVVGGDISIETGRTIDLGNATGGLETIQAFLGDIVLTTGPGGAFIEDAAIPGAVQTNRAIFVNADNVTINSGGLNTITTDAVTIRPVTPGRAIDIGTALDGPAALGLSDDEFDLLFSISVSIGDADTGPVQFTAPITPFITADVAVRSGTDILVNSSISLPLSLTLHAGDDVFFSAASNFSSANGGLIAFVDEAQNDDALGGRGTLGGAFTTATGLTLTGNVDNDILVGSSGADTLDGGGGADDMTGGLGNDRYFADSAADDVIELAGEGRDTVLAGASYTLDANVEDLTLLTVAGVASGNGNALANSITGNAADNTLRGFGEADALIGQDGADRLFGGTEGDTARGQNGDDSLFGESGDDQLFAGNDADFADAGIGNDSLFGEAGDDRLYSRDGDDFIDAGVGNDEAFGEGGVDRLRMGAGADYGDGGLGNDQLFGGDANDTLRGGGDSDQLFGESGIDTLMGDDGNDNLFGGAGSDMLRGGAGADTMRMDSASGVDQLLDFVAADDIIALNRTIFTGIAANGTLAASAFRVGSTAGDADDRIVYDQATGRIFYDADGTGATAQTLFATVTAGSVLSNLDFIGYGA